MTDDAQVGTRQTWSTKARALVETPVYNGQVLRPGATVAGQAIVELANTTIIVPEQFSLEVDAYGAFVVHSGERGAEFAARLRAPLSGAAS